MRCGEVYLPVRSPAACRHALSIATVLPLPLVPATRTDGNRRSGLPTASSNARMRSSLTARWAAIASTERGRAENDHTQSSTARYLGSGSRASGGRLQELPTEARCCLATLTRKRYLIIGNGASGTYAAETIRKTDTEGEITLVTNEPYPLYNRVALPPFLRDEAKREKVFLRRPEQHEEKGIKLLVNTQINSLDTDACVATAADGKTFEYDHLLIATGGRPNPLPAPGATPGVKGIYNFQYWDDAAAIRERINTAKHAVVVGGSYIAYELAEAYRHHGLAVTWLIRGTRFLRQV